jgi:pimeloyl-ACP methyl ester carboxylesterase
VKNMNDRLFHLSSGRTIACRTLGQGFPLVCIHAPGIGSVNFSRQYPLADTCRLILPDLPGHGRSSPLRSPFSIADLADQLHELLVLLGHERAVVLGYSQGASIALEWCLRHPDAVAGLILAGGFSEVNELYLHTRFRLAQTVAALHGVSLLARSTASSHLDDRTERRHWMGHARQTDARTLCRLYAAGHRYRCTERLQEIRVPVLLVYGQQDKPMHAYGRLLAEHLPHARLALIPGVKHQVVTRGAGPFNERCREFVQSVGREPADVR